MAERRQCTFLSRCCLVLIFIFQAAVEEEGGEETQEEKKTVKKTVSKTVWDWELINANKPIWTRNPKDIEEEEYNKFYKAFSRETKVCWGLSILPKRWPLKP